MNSPKIQRHQEHQNQNWQAYLIGFCSSAIILLFAVPAFASAADIGVWWPVPNVSLTGSQPFKAMVSGMDVNNYQMYWQVGNGQLNLMQNNYTNYPHKEVQVDLSGWHWQSNNSYQLNFVAKDMNGNIIAQNSFPIFVNTSSIPAPVPVPPPSVSILWPA